MLNVPMNGAYEKTKCSAFRRSRARALFPESGELVTANNTLDGKSGKADPLAVVVIW